MASIYRKQLTNKRKNYVERLLKNGTSSYRAEEMATNMFDRTVPDSVHEQIIKTPFSTPAYVFSTDASYASFKDFADVKAEQYVSHAYQKVEEIYKYAPEVADKIKKIENKEKVLAQKLCEAYGFTINGDPRSVLKREFEKFMSGQTTIDPGIQALIDVNAETISFDMVADTFNEQVKADKYSDSKKLKTQSTNILKRNQLASGDRQLAVKMIENSDIANGSELYKRIQQANALAKKYNNAMGFISAGKGIVQELRVGEIMRYFLSQKNNINSQVNNVLVNPLGNAESTEKIKEKVVNSLMGAIQTGISTSGGSNKLSTTDLQIDVETKTESLKLNIDIKTSNTSKYIKHDFKFSVPELEGSPALKPEMFNLGIMALVNNANVTKRVSKYSGLDKATRHLVGSVLTHKKFLDSFIPGPEEIDKDDFQNIIVVNDRLFWYSELVSSIPRNILNTATGKGKSSFYDFTMMLDDYQPLLSLATNQSQKLLQLKRKVLKRKALKQKKNYADRQPLLMADKDIQNMLAQYRQAAKSLSFNVALKFDIYDIL